MAHVGLAEALYERTNWPPPTNTPPRHRAVPAARLHPAAGHRPCPAGPDPPGPGRCGRRAGHDRPGRAGRAEPAGDPLLNPVPAWRARLMLARGEVAAAAQWASGRELEADDEPSYPREREYLVLARVLLAGHTHDRALRLLERLRTQAAAQQRTVSIIELAALQALAPAARGDQGAALASVAGALTLAAPEGYVRVFADEGALMARLLSRLSAARRAGHGTLPNGFPVDYLDRLPLALRPGRARPAPCPARRTLPSR